MHACLVGLMISLAAAQSPPTRTEDSNVARAVREVEAVVTRGPFTPDWASLAKFKTPAWYEDAKFGVFIHWDVYSVPAFRNEWYPLNMYKQGEKAFAHHVATSGPQSRFGYKDFIPRFRAEKYDARRWARLFPSRPRTSASPRGPDCSTPSSSTGPRAGA